ncbi:flagellar hook-associated protein FlgK [Spirochaeta africana]|uniref:Flagellar hook-associated protein 1 n=1 Tax=Spirochaeta africana (strain ATCC 700263 / DSM 8902 / Z-7692) TaxID=889378 RepID=H9UH95_SPIAZ|nr:flagellar hook-associated protein FlgK [Spirochaeta africana]AFG36888.1 flagellar hook-associated protein FlgK [Spirochaeta africana DSM 8902]
MQSTFSGIELAKRSINAHQIGLQTVGHNLSNASSEGYSRQRVELQAYPALDRPGLARAERPGQIGQGVEVARVSRVRDMILERRLVSQANGEEYWDQRQKYLRMVEQVYTEPGDLSVRNLMDRFWDSWQELSIHPDQMASRQAVLQRGSALMDGIQNQYQDLHRIQVMLEDEIKGGVESVNQLTRDIAALNEEIVKVEAVGDNPNDLYDRRDLLVERLGTKVAIQTDQRNPDEFSIYVGGRHIVQGSIAKQLETRPNPDNQGFSRVVWADTDEDFDPRGGSLAAHMELRDQDVRGEIQRLDNMTINFVDLVNEIHRDGSGLNERSGVDFFVERPAINNVLGNLDTNGDGAFDSSHIFRIKGANQLEPKDQIGIQGEITLSGPDGPVAVQYNPTDRVEDVVRRINRSGAEVVARLNRNNELELKGTPAADPDNPDFVIRDVQDSGEFLVGYAGILSASGLGGAYSHAQPDAVLDLQVGVENVAVAPQANPSGWIQVNPEIAREPATIAAGFTVDGRPAAPGDGSVASEIASLRNNPVMVGQTATFDDYFADSVAEIGLKGQEAEQAWHTERQIMKDLRDLRESISGVNIDEELADMIKFQHGYNAAARYMSTVNQMLDVLINRLGV